MRKQGCPYEWQEVNADGLELVVRLHKTHRNGEYNPPAKTYYYRPYVCVLSHMKNVVHKRSFGPIVFPFLPKFSVEEKAHRLLLTLSNFQQRKGNQAFLELFSKFLCLRRAGRQTVLF